MPRWFDAYGTLADACYDKMQPSVLPHKRAQSVKETRITDVLNVRSPVMH